MADVARALVSEPEAASDRRSLPPPARTTPSVDVAPKPLRLHPLVTDEGNESASVSVAVVSPYPSTRAGLRVLLDADAHLEVVAEAQSLGALAEAIGLRTPAVVVVDPAGATGASLAGVAAAGVVLLGPPPDSATALAALGERAWGYLPPDADGAELAAAVLAVHAGLFTVHPTLAARVLGRGAAPLPLSDDDGPTEELTPRELEVLSLLAEGIPNKTIARRLGISDHTVKFHVGALLGKLSASSRTEAVRTGLRRGLIAL